MHAAYVSVCIGGQTDVTAEFVHQASVPVCASYDVSQATRMFRRYANYLSVNISRTLNIFSSCANILLLPNCAC